MRMPNAEVYDLEMKYMPWGRMLDAMAERMARELPLKANVADLMCGTGYLLWKLSLLRADLELIGFDANLAYMQMLGEKQTGAAIALVEQDVVEYPPAGEYDCVICTGGVHHVVPEKQQGFIRMLADITKPGGVCLVAEPCLPLYGDRSWQNISKGQAILELGSAYLRAVITAGASSEVAAATCDIMRNDLLGDEHKLTIEELNDMYIHTSFATYSAERFWPEPSINVTYGDYVITARKSL